MTTTKSPAAWYAILVGIVLTLVGVVGLIATQEMRPAVLLFGIFDVNLAHNLVHLASGLIGLAVGFAMLAWARTYALAFGIIYLLVGVLGFANLTFMNELFANINMADNILHLLLGVAGIGAWVASKDDAHATV